MLRRAGDTLDEKVEEVESFTPIVPETPIVSTPNTPNILPDRLPLQTSLLDGAQRVVESKQVPIGVGRP